jgi:recombinational DNA repair protein (RecF pathway)
MEGEVVALKECARCGGDTQNTRDMYGAYVLCLQCGHMEDASPAVSVADLAKAFKQSSRKPGRPRKNTAA